jgi:hypothetical protein
VVFGHARRSTEEEGQHTAGERIERAAVPDAARRRQPPNERHDVV